MRTQNTRIDQPTGASSASRVQRRLSTQERFTKANIEPAFTDHRPTANRLHNIQMAADKSRAPTPNSFLPQAAVQLVRIRYNDASEKEESRADFDSRDQTKWRKVGGAADEKRDDDIYEEIVPDPVGHRAHKVPRAALNFLKGTLRDLDSDKEDVVVPGYAFKANIRLEPELPEDTPDDPGHAFDGTKDERVDAADPLTPRSRRLRPVWDKINELGTYTAHGWVPNADLAGADNADQRRQLAEESADLLEPLL